MSAGRDRLWTCALLGMTEAGLLEHMADRANWRWSGGRWGLCFLPTAEWGAFDVRMSPVKPATPEDAAAMGVVITTGSRRQGPTGQGG